MKKSIFILVLISTTLYCYSNPGHDQHSKHQDYYNINKTEQLTDEKIKTDVSEIKDSINKFVELGKKGTNILSRDINKYGLKTTLQANSNIFIPIFIFFILFLIYLKGNK